MTILNQVVQSGNYTLGNTLADISSKIYQIAFNIFDGNSTVVINGTGTANVYDYILKGAVSKLQGFLYPGEYMTSSLGNFNFAVT